MTELQQIIELLRNREFAKFYFARAISTFGSSFAPTALAFTILDIPGKNAGDLGLILASFSIAQILLLLFGGVFADRWGKVRLMVVADLLAAAAQTLMALLIINNVTGLPLLMVLSALSGAASALFVPASSGLLPQLIGISQLKMANSFLRLTLNASTIIGAASAGIMMNFFGKGQVLFIDALTFLVSACFMIGAKKEIKTTNNHSNVFKELIIGWREFVSRQWVWALVLQSAFLNAVYHVTLSVLGPAIAKMNFNGGTSWSLVASSLSLGLVLGSFFSLGINPRYPMRFAVYVSVGFSAPALALGLGLPLWAVAVAAIICGVSGAVFSVLWDTALQSHIPSEVLCRVSAYDWMGSYALKPLAFALVGPLQIKFGIAPTLIGGGLLVLISSVLTLLSPQVRDLTSTAVGEEEEMTTLELQPQMI